MQYFQLFLRFSPEPTLSLDAPTHLKIHGFLDIFHDHCDDVFYDFLSLNILLFFYILSQEYQNRYLKFKNFYKNKPFLAIFSVIFIFLLIFF
ncbi:hypothetical protein A3F66_02405 [candidate division TM6 bacterium RIFCSPHIGHO2_12_FULL_32_22]|nr:MAG: hypothetical protein A3F66_02405 [candidate division TM6 bacterium RIFCSPHIGHO2_12_FULL_32_22]